MTATATAGRMLAWRLHAYGGPAELRLERARRPPLRAPDQLLVRVRAAGLNPLDVAMTGGYGARALNALRALDGDGDGVELPLVCGRDFVGEVERAGPAARLPVGARVWGVVPPHRPGAHAQYVAVRDRWAGRAPEALDDAQCGGAPYAALSAAAAVRAAGAGAGARVLLLGLGGVGQAALQLLAARGALVIVGCAPELTALALRLGAAAAFDRHAPDYETRLLDAGPYAAVVDCAGLGAAGAGRWRGARYVTLTSPLLREMEARGAVAGAAAAAAALAAAQWRGGGAGSVRWAFFSARAEELEALRRLAEAGRFRVHVQRLVPWWAAAEAYAAAARGGARGKVVIDWTREREPGAEPDPDSILGDADRIRRVTC